MRGHKPTPIVASLTIVVLLCAAALTAVNGDPPDLILLDLSLPLLDGLELFRILRQRPAR